MQGRGHSLCPGPHAQSTRDPEAGSLSVARGGQARPDLQGPSTHWGAQGHLRGPRVQG